MKVSYNVEIETRNGAVKTEEGKAIIAFLKSEDKNMCLEYDTVEEAKKRSACVASMCRKLNKTETQKLSYSKRNNKIYVLKENEV